MDRKKVIIVDDERSARLLIHEYLEAYPEFEVIAEASNGFEAVKCINDQKPDIVFLDIQMPGHNGFEVLQHLEEIPEIVFSTAFDSYALDAFEVHAIDYLLKPYTKDRFAATIQKLKTANSFFGLIPLTEEMFQRRQKYATRVLATKQRKLIPVETSNIFYAEAYGDFCKLYLKDKTFTSNHGISALQEKLDPELFLRTHRSFIVNINFVKEIQKTDGNYEVVLKDGRIVPISRRNTSMIRKLII